jgi:hypothetical protein
LTQSPETQPLLLLDIAGVQRPGTSWTDVFELQKTPKEIISYSDKEEEKYSGLFRDD